jgi:hypothetical protein
MIFNGQTFHGYSLIFVGGAIVTGFVRLVNNILQIPATADTLLRLGEET